MVQRTSPRLQHATLGAKYYTPEITKVTFDWNIPLNIHWKFPINIHWEGDNPLENAAELRKYVGKRCRDCRRAEPKNLTSAPAHD